jgi:predicted CXXCH cytochrome family protein
MKHRWFASGVLAATLTAWLVLGGLPSAAAEEEAALPTDDPTWMFPKRPVLEPADRILFSHRLHIRVGEICSDCHPNAETATEARTVVLPDKPFCFDCHETPDEQDNCAMCHANAERPSATLTWSTQELSFNHAAHMALDDVDCATCHPDAEQSRTTLDRLVPPMATCTSCHQPEMDRLACSTCHTDLGSLNMPPAEQAVHKPGFFPLHGAWARGQAALCRECHEETFCSDCHANTTPVRPSMVFPDLVERTFVHRGDFVGRHALEARANPASCASCHGQTFCNDCHSQALAPAAFPGFPGRLDRRSPHPVDYVNRGGEGFHGTDARMNPMHCATCHDQGAASNCVDCHRVGGVGGNPHPPGWSRRGRETEMAVSRACLPCHAGN